MNARAIVTLGLLLAAANGKSPERLLADFHEKLRAKQSNDPAGTTVQVVLAATVAFYMAEHEQNPKIGTLYDALVYVSTNISVGHSDILARTPLGKTIGSALMTYGPALAARTLDSKPSPVPPAESGLGEVTNQLERILEELILQRKASERQQGAG